ncbi:hypothetical protein ARMSODRAFT_613706 [Armillaria solidipes]|uniref:Uncharacterized protein n=1 Tax=Armillaria solidipes TaxID=1076256 RepID=A0A2H3B7J2_9AGAR|nr:hypothetical protein ARMSODRAFT_613706 [Armillaria solidipes]
MNLLWRTTACTILLNKKMPFIHDSRHRYPFLTVLYLSFITSLRLKTRLHYKQILFIRGGGKGNHTAIKWYPSDYEGVSNDQTRISNSYTKQAFGE